MKKLLGAFAVLFAALAVMPAFAHHGLRAKHHGAGHGRHAYRAVGAPPPVSYSVPPALERRDPWRVGGLDPSFNPRGR
jgi:hypothetical protein